MSPSADPSPPTEENPSTRSARSLVTALVAAGVRDVVLAPGSRSAPLAYALAAAAGADWLRVHVRVDERSAGFVALGLARERPTAVVTTAAGRSRERPRATKPALRSSTRTCTRSHSAPAAAARA